MRSASQAINRGAQAVNNTYNSMMNRGQQLWDSAKQTGQQFATDARDTARGIGMYAQDAGNAIANGARGGAAAVGFVGNQLGNMARDKAQQIGQSIQNDWNDTKRQWAQAGGQIRNDLNRAGQAVGNAVNNGVQAVNNGVQAGVNAGINAGRAAGQAVQNGVQAAGNAVGNAYDKASDWMSGAMYGNTYRNAMNSMQDAQNARVNPSYADNPAIRRRASDENVRQMQQYMQPQIAAENNNEAMQQWAQGMQQMQRNGVQGANQYSANPAPAMGRLISVAAHSHVLDKVLDDVALLVDPAILAAPMLVEGGLDGFHLFGDGGLGMALHAGIDGGVDFEAVGVDVDLVPVSAWDRTHP